MTQPMDSGTFQQSNTLEGDGNGVPYANADDLDTEIENSLKIAAKYLGDGDRDLADDELLSTINKKFRDENTDHNDIQSCEARYLKPIPRPIDNVNDFSRICTVYKRQQFLMASAEDGSSRLNCGKYLLQIHGNLDKLLLRQRFGNFFLDENIDDGSKYIIRDVLKPENTGDELQMHRYTKAENWKTSSLRINFENYTPLNVYIGSLQFIHHWLFTEEDVLSNSIQQLHSTQTAAANELLHLLHEVINLKRRYDILTDADKHRKQIQSKMESVFVALNEQQRRYLKLAKLIGSKWKALKIIRKRQGYASTSLQLNLVPFNEQYQFASGTSEFSDFLQSLNDTPIYTISDTDLDEEQNKPKEEIDRISLISQIHIQIQILFNNIPVCKTKFVPMNKNFSASIDQTYKLQVYEVPELITAVIFEKNHTGSTYELAKVGIPLLNGDEWRGEKTEESLESMHFACDKAIPGHYNSIGCGNENPCITGILHCAARYQSKVNFYEQTNWDKCSIEPQTIDKKFELIPNEVRLCSDEEFDCLMRFYPTFGSKLSPHNCFDIISTLNELNQQKLFAKDESRRNALSKTTLKIDALRLSTVDFITLLRSNLCERLSEGHGAKSLHDIVHEDPVPTIFGAFSTLFKNSDTSRKLKPMRKATTSELFQTDFSYRLFVNVQSAVNLPVRNDGKLQPFVEVIFQNTVVSTQVVGGANPNWQESLEVPLSDTFKNRTDLKSVSDKIQIYIFDQIVTKLDSDDRESNTVHEQLEKHFLGSIQIPFSSLKVNDKIDGYLRIDTPIYLSSYRLSEGPCYLKLLVTLLPKICTRSSRIDRVIIGSESDENVFRCLQWKKGLSEKFPNRRYACLMFDPNGRQIFASRFLRPVEPPPCLSVNPTFQFAEQACRIASCIPHISDYSSFNTFVNIWATLDQLLALGFGNEGEHAVILCCWLLSAGIQSFVILGNSLPEGINGAYVVAVFPERSVLLNPVSGSFHLIDDPLCPLTSVGTVITVDNVYGNIQLYEHPSQIQFDLKKRNHWLPVLDKDYSMKMSIQPEALTYRQAEKSVIVELRSYLERDIKVTFDKSRLYGIPHWSLLAARILRGILSEVDVALDIDAVERRLAELKSSFRINTVIIRQRYTSVEDLVQRIIRMNFHNNSNQRAQFALAVHFETFSSNIISVIIAIATLSPY